MRFLQVSTLRISKRLYAFNPESYDVKTDMSFLQEGTGFPTYESTIEVIWFKKARGKITVHIGSLWNRKPCEFPPTLDEFIDDHSAQRFGGTVLATWDGEKFWSNNVRNESMRRLVILRLDSFLQNYPSIPAGWIGWFTLEDGFHHPPQMKPVPATKPAIVVSTVPVSPPLPVTPVEPNISPVSLLAGLSQEELDELDEVN